MPLFGSALKPMARICRRYSPAGRFSTRYLPALSDSTLTVILVLRLRACTKAPRNGLPSGPVTVPVMVAASAADIAAMIEPTPSMRRVVARMGIPPGLKPLPESLAQSDHRRHSRRGAVVREPGRSGYLQSVSQDHRITSCPSGDHLHHDAPVSLCSDAKSQHTDDGNGTDRSRTCFQH